MPVAKKQTPKKKVAKKTVRKKTGGIADRIQSMGFETDDYLKVLVYGRSGTGKTTFWSTFPGKILALICSGGKNPGELRSINTPANRKRIDKVVIEGSEDIDAIVEHQESTGEYDCIVLDHASGLQDKVLGEILGEKPPEQLSWGLASQQQYGQVAAQAKERFRSLLDLNCNTVIVAQERDFNTDAKGDVLLPFVAAALTPSIVGWLNPAVDYIVQTYLREEVENTEIEIAGQKMPSSSKTGKMEYCLRTGPHAVFTTKFRIPKGRELPDSIVDPTYKKLKSLIDGD